MPQQIDLGQFIWPDVSQGRQPQSGDILSPDYISGAPSPLFATGYNVPVGTTVSRGGFSAPGVGAAGRSFAFSSNSYSDVLADVVTAAGWVSSSAYTLIAIAQFDNSGTYSAILDHDLSVLRCFQFRKNNSDQIEAIGFNTAATSIVTSTTGVVAIGSPVAIAAVYNGNSVTAYAQGASAGATQTITGTPQSFNGVVALGASGGGLGAYSFYGLGGKLFAWAVLPFAATPVQIAQFLANPWQLFATPSIPMFVPMGGGGATAYSLTCSAGSYAYTGVASTLALARKFSAATGSYNYTGQAATLKVARQFAAAAGSYAINGQAATLKLAHAFPAAAGSYVINGEAAVLTYSPGGSSHPYTLSCASGSYAITGEAAALLYTSGAQFVTLKAGSWIRYRTI